jgi:ATP-binding cassette, subfamily B, bacterial
METPERLKLADGLNKITLIDLLHPHGGMLLLALLAVAGEIAADLLEPWPLKVVIDYVVQSKTIPGWLAPAVRHLTDDNRFAVLNLAVASAVAIALIGALSSYAEKY